MRHPQERTAEDAAHAAELIGGASSPGRLRAAVIANAGAGTGYADDWKHSLQEKFAAAGIDAQVTLARGGEEIATAVRAGLDQGIALIVAGGGDGTINAVASHLVDRDATLGVLPLGTLNHFAKDLGIPLALDDAIRTIASGHATHVDAGEVNGSIFINNSSIGLYPDMVRHREQQQHRLGKSKWPAFVSAALHTLRRYPVLGVELVLDGKALHRRTPFVFVGNNEYSMEGFNIGARARLCDARLSIYVGQRVGRFGLLLLALRALFGRLRQASDFDAISTTEAVIRTRKRRLRVATDGEVQWMDTPLHYRSRPCALRVLVPAPAPDSESA